MYLYRVNILLHEIMEDNRILDINRHLCIILGTHLIYSRTFGAYRKACTLTKFLTIKKSVYTLKSSDPYINN